MIQFSSQYGEDRWLAKHWGRLGLPEHGIFCEVGAGDGHELSNTLWLELEKGWRGLLCEPDPRQLIDGRERSVIERCAVGPEQFIDLALTRDELLSGQLRQQSDDPRLHVLGWHRVPQRPLSELLAKHGFERLDVLSIDTEGTELEAWGSLDLSRWRPRVAIIELTTWGLGSRHIETVGEMQRCGYRFVKRTDCNGIFVDESCTAQF